MNLYFNNVFNDEMAIIFIFLDTFQYIHVRIKAFGIFLQLGESELPPLPRVDNSRHVVPDTIRPKLARTRVEVSRMGEL